MKLQKCKKCKKKFFCNGSCGDLRGRCVCPICSEGGTEQAKDYIENSSPNCFHGLTFDIVFKVDPKEKWMQVIL